MQVGEGDLNRYVCHIVNKTEQISLISSTVGPRLL